MLNALIICLYMSSYSFICYAYCLLWYLWLSFIALPPHTYYILSINAYSMSTLSNNVGIRDAPPPRTCGWLCYDWTPLMSSHISWTILFSFLACYVLTMRLLFYISFEGELWICFSPHQIYYVEVLLGKKCSRMSSWWPYPFIC